MSNGKKTSLFLSLVDAKCENMILGSIANHYGTTKDAIRAEVTDDEAEHLLEYMIEPERAATALLMDRHGVR